MQVVLFVLLLFAWTDTSGALEIKSPREGETFEEGDIINVVAELSEGDPEILYVRFNTTGALDDCEELSTHPHYECSFVIPPDSPSLIQIKAIAPTVDGKVVHSQKITILISLPPTVMLKSLRSFNGNKLFFSRIGEKKQLSIIGIFSDDIERHLSSSSSTIYQSSDPNIVNVNPEGVVTAISSGIAVITIENGNQQLRIEAVVELQERPRRK